MYESKRKNFLSLCDFFFTNLRALSKIIKDEPVSHPRFLSEPECKRIFYMAFFIFRLKRITETDYRIMENAK
ncbi:hypothetical protein BXP28_10630 [Paenibacillus larvae subsp. larvae]|nr:hypothetical protein BXP28_10630 [Paenibacillus larvae subsp. larvae]